MSRYLRYILPAVALLAVGLIAWAQEGPPPRPQDMPGGFEDRMRPPPPPPMNRPDPMRFAEALRAYIDTVDRFTQLSRDSTASGVAAVLQAREILERRSPDQAIAFLKKMQPTVKNDVVRRAIDLQLVELYKKFNKTDEAIDILQNLMTSAPPTTEPASSSTGK